MESFAFSIFGYDWSGLMTDLMMLLEMVVNCTDEMRVKDSSAEKEVVEAVRTSQGMGLVADEPGHAYDPGGQFCAEPVRALPRPPDFLAPETPSQHVHVPQVQKGALLLWARNPLPQRPSGEAVLLAAMSPGLFFSVFHATWKKYNTKCLHFRQVQLQRL